MKYRKLHHWKYELMEKDSISLPIVADIRTPYICLRHNTLTIMEGYAWDGASFIAVDTDTIMRASLFHDGLYQLMKEGLLDKRYRKITDQIFRDLCLLAGMGRFRAWYCYNAVRIGGGLSINKKSYPKGEIIEI